MDYPNTPTQAVTRAIRSSMAFSAVVDIDGVQNPKTGGFWQPQDAIDAGHKSIFIRNGTYASFVVDQSQVTIVGESEADTIIDGGIAAHAIEVSGSFAHISMLQVKTTAGGGSGFSGIYQSAGGLSEYHQINCVNSDASGIAIIVGSVNVIDQCQVYSEIDVNCVYVGAPVTQVTGCYLASGGSNGVTVSASGDNARVIGNHVASCTGTGILINADAENCVIVANRVTGNTTAQITDNSGTSTEAGNDET